MTADPDVSRRPSIVGNLLNITKKGKAAGRKGLRQEALMYGPNTSTSSSSTGTSNSCTTSSTSASSTSASNSDSTTNSSTSSSASVGSDVEFKLGLVLLEEHGLDMVLPSNSASTFTMNVSILTNSVLKESMGSFKFSNDKPLSFPMALPSSTCTTSAEVMDTMEVEVELRDGSKGLATATTKLPQQNCDIELSVQLEPWFTSPLYEELVPCTQPPTITLGIYLALNTKEPAEATGLGAASSPLVLPLDSNSKEEDMEEQVST